MSDLSSAEVLRPPGANTSIKGYVGAVWSLRRYAWLTGKSQVSEGNAGTSLGALWLFLEPVFSILIYWLIFGLLLDVSRGVDNFLAFLTIGQVTFGFSQRAFLGASSSLTTQAPMLRSMAFPRAVLPLAAALKAFAAYRAEAAVMLLAIVLMGESIRVSWVFLMLLVPLQAAVSFGLGMGLARVVFVYPDTQRLITHLMRLGFYGSGVFFPMQAFTDSPLVLRAVTLNPFYDFVELARWATLGLQPPYAGLTVAAAVAW
ncbi:MAG: ABC transporter permease, partial [Acidimicrobiaceae bacterium]|nr:ABC transporter permease [Acidimicrobiaceae bacterium]